MAIIASVVPLITTISLLTGQTTPRFHRQTVSLSPVSPWSPQDWLPYHSSRHSLLSPHNESLLSHIVIFHHSSPHTPHLPPPLLLSLAFLVRPVMRSWTRPASSCPELPPYAPWRTVELADRPSLYASPTPPSSPSFSLMTPSVIHLPHTSVDIPHLLTNPSQASVL